MPLGLVSFKVVLANLYRCHFYMTDLTKFSSNTLVETCAQQPMDIREQVHDVIALVPP